MADSPEEEKIAEKLNTPEQRQVEEDGAEDCPKSSEPIDSNDEHITGFKLWTVLASLTVVMFLVMLDMSIIVTAIPRITTYFHSLSNIGWYGSAYLLASCALQPLTGKLYSQFNIKYTFLFFLAVFELGSLLCATAQSSNMLIVGRAVAGMGASGLINGALTILAASSPLHKRPVNLGIIMSISQISIATGPLIGGALTQYVSWRWCFYINLPLGGAAAILLLAIKIPKTKNQKEDKSQTFLNRLLDLDPTGFILFASFAVMFLLALEWGGTKYSWRSATVIGLFCGSGVTLLIFATWEYYFGDKAMIPYSVLTRRIVWCSCLATWFFSGTIFMFSYYLPLYFQSVKGVSPALSGVYMFPSILTQIIGALLSGLLVTKSGYYLPWAVVSAAIIAISAGLVSTFSVETSTAKWVMYQFIGGFGRGLGMQMPFIAIENDLPSNLNSIGLALLVFSQTFGGSLWLTFAQIIFSNGLVSGLKAYAPTVDVNVIVEAGASAIRQVVNSSDLPGVLKAYSTAINHNFYLAAGAAVMMFIFSWGIGWRRITKKKTVSPEA